MAHVTGAVVFAMGCVLGIMSAVHLVRAWRWRPWGPDGTESKYYALGGALHGHMDHA